MCPVDNTQPLKIGFWPQVRAQPSRAWFIRITTELICALFCFLRTLPHFNRNFVHLALLPALILLVSACATPVAHHTPSGKPEVTIFSTDGELIKNLVISEMIDRGYSVSSEREYSIAFDRPVDNVFAAALLGSQYNSTPNARITYTVVRTPNGHSRVVATLQVVTNPGSSHERYTDASGNRDSVEIQALLDRVRDRIEADMADETLPESQPLAPLSTQIKVAPILSPDIAGAALYLRARFDSLC